jgi:hypothetical protein
MPGPTRPADDGYYVAPHSPIFLQGDLFRDLPLGFPFPPDAIAYKEGTRVFLTGPFDVGIGMLTTPTCIMSAQGKDVSPGSYAHAARTLVPVRSLDEVMASGAIREQQRGNLVADRLRGYLYLPASDTFQISESVALLYLPITVHHDVIVEERFAQLGGEAHRHLAAKLIAYWSGLVLGDVDEALGPAQPDLARTR